MQGNINDAAAGFETQGFKHRLSDWQFMICTSLVAASIALIKWEHANNSKYVKFHHLSLALNNIGQCRSQYMAPHTML